VKVGARAGALAAAIAAVLSAGASGCGSDEHGSTVTGETTPAASAGAPAATTTAKLPPGAQGPAGTTDLGAEGPAAGEASPEAPAKGPATGDLSGIDEEAATQTVRSYIDALDRHDAAGVCDLLAPGALKPAELQVSRGGCRQSLAASIGHRPEGGAPAWRRTDIAALTAVSVEGEGARVTATVTHKFSDRHYTSVEEDVIYLKPVGGQWLLAKPSGTFYRAVGYPEPPLHALEPPRT
jgi:hypothetical protein